jgi:hypothetical protein
MSLGTRDTPVERVLRKVKLGVAKLDLEDGI